MKMKTTKTMGPGGIELVGEALHLIRMAPLHVLSSYFIGSAPFILGFLYFWSDMSRSAFAHQRCFNASLGLAVLFVWMKTWQSIFASGLRRHITGAPDPGWTLAGIRRTIARQTAIQPYGLLLIPASMTLAVPFFAVYSFYQNATVLDEGNDVDMKLFRKRAWRQALVWPGQNHTLMWLLNPWILAAGMIAAFGSVWLLLSFSPELRGLAQELDTTDKYMMAILSIILIYHFALPLAPLGCIVAGNIALLLVVLPAALNFVAGIETSFTLSGIHGIMNTTFLMTVYSLSYLCLDPVIKAAYVLRCFYGESEKTGQDLLVELKTLHREAT